MLFGPLHSTASFPADLSEECRPSKVRGAPRHPSLPLPLLASCSISVISDTLRHVLITLMCFPPQGAIVTLPPMELHPGSRSETERVALSYPSFTRVGDWGGGGGAAWVSAIPLIPLCGLRLSSCFFVCVCFNGSSQAANETCTGPQIVRILGCRCGSLFTGARVTAWCTRSLPRCSSSGKMRHAVK